jgi:gamma-glutamylcyclotransferase (GGCT)/AIG2-like uncharacterized protein YtfP
MSDYLFVYGTLMSSAHGIEMGADARRRLQQEARSLGAATIAGSLFDLGAYPALVDEAAGGERVTGEVFELETAAAVWPWLDAYESVEPDGTAPAEYARAQRPVRLTDGREVLAWVYLYRGSTRGRRRIAGGQWQPGAP